MAWPRPLIRSCRRLNSNVELIDRRFCLGAGSGRLFYVRGPHQSQRFGIVHHRKLRDSSESPRTARRELGPFLGATRQFYVSINVPPVLLAERRLAELLEASNLLPCVSRIVFEITERQALDERGREAIRRGRKLGARVALDDFGTGQSGFRDLIGLEVDFIKLDHSYIEPLNCDPLTERLV